MISYKCLECGGEMNSPESLAGQEEKCPACGHVCAVPKIKGRMPLILGICGGAAAVVVLAVVVVMLSSGRPPHPLMAPLAEPRVHRAIARLGELQVVVQSNERRSKDDDEHPLEKVVRNEAEYVLELLGFEPVFISHDEIDETLDALLLLDVFGHLRSQKYRGTNEYWGRSMDTGYSVRVGCQVVVRKGGVTSCTVAYDKPPPDQLSEREANETKYDYKDTVEQAAITAILGAIFRADTSRIKEALENSKTRDEAWNALALIGPPALPLLVDAAGNEAYDVKGPATALFWMWRNEKHRDAVLAELQRADKTPRSSAIRKALAGLWLNRGLSPSSRRTVWFTDDDEDEDEDKWQWEATIRRRKIALAYLRLVVEAYPESPEAEKARAGLQK